MFLQHYRPFACRWMKLRLGPANLNDPTWPQWKSKRPFRTEVESNLEFTAFHHRGRTPRTDGRTGGQMDRHDDIIMEFKDVRK